MSEETRRRFARLASQTGRPMTQLLGEAADALERRLFFDDLQARFGLLRDDPVAWAGIQAERQAESASIHDRSV